MYSFLATHCRAGRVPANVPLGEKAYWNVATKRLVDNVCMTLEQDFVVKLLTKVESELFLLTNRYTDVDDLFVEVGGYSRGGCFSCSPL